MPPINRRDLLVVAAGAAALAVAPPLRAAIGFDVDRFLSLSARLTGVSLADLDASAASSILAGFLSLGRGGELDSLAADPDATAPLANDIVAAWYSGTYATGAGLASFGLTHALLWNALDYTKPPGLCGVRTGHWADPPAR
jgi:hypothetical protein